CRQAERCLNRAKHDSTHGWPGDCTLRSVSYQRRDTMNLQRPSAFRLEAQPLRFEVKHRAMPGENCTFRLHCEYLEAVRGPKLRHHNVGWIQFLENCR